MKMPASGREELLDLCSRLRGEKLLVTSEIEHLQQLNQDVDQRLSELLQYSWISRQQQFTLSKLVNAHPDATPQNCCYQARTLQERTEFFEAYRKLDGGVNELAVGDLLRLLYENSRLMAECLHRCDALDPQQIYDLSHIVFSAVYGCAVFPCDERRVLETLYYLMRLQLPNASQARRLLRRGTCAFSRLYKWLITDGGGLYSTKLFLLSALHQPIIDLISSEELFLDIDPGKAVVRFPAPERLKRFGEEGTVAYKENLSKYRRDIVARLVSLAQRFIQSLKQSFYTCFPPPLAWLLRQLYESLTSSGKTTSSEASLIVTDLVFTCFICPAIANPEPLGIVVETPITHIARFNLMQIGQILQTLAVSPWEKVDPKLLDLYGQLDAESVASLVTALLSTQQSAAGGLNRAMSPNSNPGDDGTTSAALAVSSLEEVYEKSDNISRPGYDGGVQSTRLALMTVGELNRLTQALRRVAQDFGTGGDGQQSDIRRELLNVLSRLPDSFADDQQTQQLQPNGGSASSPSSAGGGARKKTPLKLPKPRIPSMMTNSPSVERFQNLLSGGNSEATTPDGGPSALNRSEPDILWTTASSQQVLMIPLGGQRDPVGLTPEEVFLTAASSGAGTTGAKQAAAKDGDIGASSGDASAAMPAVGGTATHEKRTRFSLQNQPDLESVGTSDQLDDDDRESVSSSVDAGTNPDMQGLLNDNFSDVDAAQMSPTVSARGSPNVSGRDTPLSSHTEQQVEPEMDAPISPSAACASGGHHRHEGGDVTAAAIDQSPNQPRRHHQHHFGKRSLLMPDLPVTAQKENGADIEEKFGKFEIPAGQHHRERHRDETHSLVSDSWSTDVLASDSEFGGEYAAAAPPGGICPAGSLPDIVPGHIPEFPRLDLIAEEGAAAAASGGAAEARASGGGVARFDSLVGADAEALMAGDRSDTWSVDAMASDSEMDVSSVTQRNEELRDMEMEEARADAADGAAAAEERTVCGRDANGEPDSEGAASTGAAASASASSRGVSIPPEITFSMERDFHQLERGVVRRQSSGSSFVSRQSDPDEGAHSGQAKPESTSDSVKPKEQGETSSRPEQASDQGRGHLSSASSDASSVDTASARAISGSPTADERQLAAMRATGAIPKKFRQISAHLAGSLERNNPFHHGAGSSHQYPGLAAGGGEADARRGFFKGFNKGFSNLKSKVKRSQTTGEGGFASPGGMGRSESPEASGRSDNLEAGMITYSASVGSFNNSVENAAGASAEPGETSDEILAKYRCQKTSPQPAPLDLIPSNPSPNPSASASTGINGYPSVSDFTDTSSLAVQPPSSVKSDKLESVGRENGNESANSVGSDTRPYFDPHNVTQCQAFLDAKRKLRQVLSSVDVAVLPSGFDTTAIPKSPKEEAGRGQTNHDLIQFLRLLLADALTDNKLEQQKFITAQLRETLRCLTLFDNKTIRKLLRALHDEHRRRTAYVAYLQQSRLTLLQMRAYLEKLTGRIMREQTLSCECLLELCSRIFLEQRWEQQIRRFVAEFHKLEAHDEKTDLVEKFLTQLYSGMQNDPIWKLASEEQLQFARLSIERSVMAQIYLASMYPNGEGDTMRDHIFYETIKKLAAIITPSHRDLRIPVEYHAECPWPSAQAEIAIINAYKTPRDKVGCVLRCCQTIVSLLRLARPDGRPAADDVMPVLVYVVIKSNPPSLLSTVQYVSNFYGTRLQGEEAYWWTQFCSAVEFIKMMADYNQAN